MGDAGAPAAPGGGDPRRDAARVRTAFLICAGIGSLLFVVNAVVEVRARGLEPTLMGSLLALAPAPLYMLLFIWIDRFEPEPGWALALAFAWGALPAGLASTALNDAFLARAVVMLGVDPAISVASTIWAPVVEELCKGAGLLLVLVFLRREFDTMLDGVVYGGVIGLGFATAENVDYYARGFAQEDPALLELALSRGVLKPFAHSFYTALTGIGCGISRESRRGLRQLVAPVAGLLGACAIHMIHNTIADRSDFYLLGYLGVMVPLFVVFLAVVASLLDRERRIVRQMLAFEVERGTLPAEHVALATSRISRPLWLLRALPRPSLLARRWRYLALVAKLAFCHFHIGRADPAPSESPGETRIDELRREIADLRAAI